MVVGKRAVLRKIESVPGIGNRIGLLLLCLSGGLSVGDEFAQQGINRGRQIIRQRSRLLYVCFIQQQVDRPFAAGCRIQVFMAPPVRILCALNKKQAQRQHSP